MSSISSSSSSSISSSISSSNSSSNSSSIFPASSSCFSYRSSVFILNSFSATNILLLLPLCILVLHLGLQRWRQNRRSASAATSHSDVFTYHLVAMETVGVLGCALFCVGVFFGMLWSMVTGLYLFSVTSYGQLLFHTLTCAERHLAVVHPITYLGLRQRGGVRVRNFCVLCIWLLFFASFSLVVTFSAVAVLCILTLSAAVVSFCSLSVLRSLIGPGPGEGGGDRERVHQSKMRAFYTITAILGALVLRFGGHVLVVVVHSYSAATERVRCEVLVSGVWFGLPSSLVLPLLFLHRAGKLRW